MNVNGLIVLHCSIGITATLQARGADDKGKKKQKVVSD